MAYVPPALRRKQEAALKGKDERSYESPKPQSFDPSAKFDSRSLRDIQKHFWPNWISETPFLVRKSEGDPADVENLDGKSDQNGDTGLGGGNTSADQVNADEQPTTELLELNDSVEASAKSDTRSDVSHQAPKPAQRELGGPENSLQPSTQQLQDSVQFKKELASDKGKLLATEGNHDIAKKIHHIRSDLPVLESVHPHNTLNSTEQSPDSLQYVLLFHDANPRWLSDQIIYVKSALELLPMTNQDDNIQTENTSQNPLAKNIMVFEQQNGHRTPTSAMFKFIGYFNLVQMQILEPQTPELVRMQEQKWTRKDKYGRNKPINRNAESWKKSLNQRWAVLGFEKNEKATEQLASPQIETSSRRDANDEAQMERRNVNDMLREMRMKDGS